MTPVQLVQNSSEALVCMSDLKGPLRLSALLCCAPVNLTICGFTVYFTPQEGGEIRSAL